MTTFDFAPLYRSAIGFDRLASLLDSANNHNQTSYPPYNVELVDENQYRITMAVAGFSEAELEIEIEGESLKVSGRREASTTEAKFLHRGIAERNFERKFQLADHVKVTDARLENGLLHVELRREVPEAMKPRKISIQSGDSAKLIDGKADDQKAA